MKAWQIRSMVHNDLKVSSHRGCFIYHTVKRDPNGTHKAHERMKFEVFAWARDMGYEVITEARFKDGKRADVVIISDFNAWIVEIETNQDPKNIEKKKATYQYDWVDYIAVIDPSKEFDEKMIL